MIAQARKKLNYHDHAIEWSKTTCYLKDLGLYFRSISDVGHWLAEQGTNMMYLSPTARKKNKVRRYIEKEQPLYGYVFQYVSEEDYFDIIENHEIISYAYQEHREIPLQVKK